MHDTRYALRGLRRSPGFTVTVILTLGLGIGANAAMFGVIDRLMLRPFSYLRNPAEVHRVYLQVNARDKLRTQNQIPYARYLDLKKFTSSFSQYAGFTEWRLAVGVGDASREVQVAGVTASVLRVLPTRVPHADDSSSLRQRTPYLAERTSPFWVTTIGSPELGGRNVVGQSLQVGPLLTTIIEVFSA